MYAHKKQILKHLNRYSKVPSLSGREDELWAVVKKDFLKNGFESFENYNENGLQWAFVFSARNLINNSPGNIVFTVHLDRVPGHRGEALVNNIKDLGDILQGQLDDSIGIVILKILFDKLGSDFPFSILFTTEEEIVRSPQKILRFLNFVNVKLHLISLDIDVFHDLSDLKEGHITLRDRDANGVFDPFMLERMRRICNDNKIPYFINEGTAIVETGFINSMTGGAVIGNHIGIPIVNYHTDQEQTHFSTVENAIKLISLL